MYTPAGYSARGPHLALVIVFDGEMYGNAADALIPTPRVLDNLLAAKRIPATVAVLVNNMSQDARDRDLRCSPAFGDFLATELLPYVRARYRVSHDPSQVVLAGSSDGGLAALCAAHQHFKVFGNVLSQSANVFYSPESAAPANAYLRDSGWLTRKFVTTPLLPLRFYLEVGVLEAGRGQSCRGTSPVTRRARCEGVSHCLLRVPGGHDFFTWQNSLGDGLIALLGRERIRR